MMIKKHLWLLIFPFIFIVYSTSFNDFKILEQKHSVLAEADSANFAILIKDFHISKKYGDEYNTDNRSLFDIAQKHKIHHFLYVIVGNIIYKVFSVIYTVFGIPQSQALYSVNALIGCFNLGLLYILLRYFQNGESTVRCFLWFYAFSLSTWLYGSVPESWSFTITLILLFLVLFYRAGLNPYILSVFIGIAMLNNMFLGSLFIFLLMRFFRSNGKWRSLLGKASLSLLTIFSTWLLSLFVLSFFDDSFRPDNVFKYTIWFKKFIGYNHVPWSLYVWKVIFTNLFVNTILSNQSNPAVPQEALLYTLRESYVGIISTIIYLILFATVILRILFHIRKLSKEKKGFLKIIEKEDNQLLLYCLLWVFLTLILFPPGAFLYSTTIVPLMIILTARFTNQERVYDKVLLYATIAAVIINNSFQVMKFRDALRGMV